MMEEGYTDLLDDYVEANQPDEPCPVCGGQTYSLVGGFYYCTICSTQSQVTRLFVEEEEFGTLYTPHKTKIAVANGGTRTPTKKTSAGVKSTTVSSWEVHNFVLNQIADKLIAMGFPVDVKPRILELWCNYLKRRGVLRVSQDGETSAAISRREPKQNLVALFGEEKTQRKVRKKVQRKKEKPIEEAEVDPTNPGTPRKQKRFLKAYQEHYAEMERTGVNASQSQAESVYQFDDTDVRDLNDTIDNSVTSTSKRKASMVNQTLSKGLSAAQQGADGRWSLSRTEEFTVSSALQIAYAALRLTGCPVLITDLVRLHQQGAFELDKVKDFLMAQNESLSMNTFLFLSGGHDLTPVRFATCIDSLFDYLNIDVPAPEVDDYIPKLMDDTKLPREFEYFVKKFVRLVPMDNLTKKTGANRHFIDLKVFSAICIVLQLLFGFDDLTEKYQAKFAQAVNQVISAAVEASGQAASETANWSKLFDVEEWSLFWNVRNDVVSSTLTLSSRNGQHYLNTKFSESYGVARDSLLETLGIDASPILEDPVIPVVSPSLPFEDVTDSYLQCNPDVPDSMKDILNSDFMKRRIDFIYKPEKYIRLLKKAGVRVHVFSGTAANYDLSSFDEKHIPLFQPYKEFENSFSLKNTSANLKSLVQQFCSVWCAGFSSEGVLELVEEFTNSLSDDTALACLTGSIPFL